ncbi:MAG TPA: outer membrane protein transport protein [Burkholderiales bacterium]|nr:outer membrane protein transport protein [Burkholderiales bacterium]
MVGRKLASVAVAAALGGAGAGAIAGGFAIGTQSGSGTGNAFAGGAAAADDASVAWFNPALMPLIPGKQVAGALHALKPSFKFTNQGSTGAFAAPGTGDGGDGGDWAYVPNAFFTMAINPNWSFGLALNAPFGLKTEYDDGWRGDFTARKSEIKSANFNPSIAYKVSDTVSIGGGVSVQKLDADLTNSLAALGLGVLRLEADDIGYGYNLGVMIQAGPTTRIGAHYRSKIKYELEGDVSFSAVAAGNGSIKADLEVPPSASLSIFQTLGNWELMGDLTWTGWSSLQQLQVIRTSTAAALGPFPGAAGSTLTTLQFQWDDTWRYGIGVNYKMSPQTKLRFGVALDETPTNDQFRTARLPDEDRTWVALGVQYRPSKTSILDIGYAHEFIKDARVSNTSALGTFSGTFENKADIFSIQYSMSF